MAQRRLSMRKTSEILRLKHQAGLTNRQIACSCGVGRSTVASYLERAEKAGLTWPLPEELDEERRRLDRRLVRRRNGAGGA